LEYSGSKAIADALKINYTLKELVLGIIIFIKTTVQNSMSSNGVKEIYNSLKNNTTLENFALCIFHYFYYLRWRKY